MTGTTKVINQHGNEATREVMVPLVGSLMSGVLITALPLAIVWHIAPPEAAGVATLFSVLAIFGCTVGGTVAVNVVGSLNRAKQRLVQELE